MDEDWPNLDLLLVRARGGDSRALGELLNTYRHYLTLLARVEIRREFQAKVGPSDVVQEVMLKAAVQFSQFRGCGSAELAGWLRAILASTLVDRVHRAWTRQQRDVRLERQLHQSVEQSSASLTVHIAARQESPSADAIQQEETLRYAKLLESLPEHYRTVIVLRHLEGLTLDAIAERIGRSPDSVQKLWVRALAMIREQWETDR